METELWEDIEMYPDAIKVLTALYRNNRSLCNTISQARVQLVFEIAMTQRSATHLNFLRTIAQVSDGHVSQWVQTHARIHTDG